MCDTSDLKITSDLERPDPGVLRAIRKGGRIALELLRAQSMPEAIHLSSLPSAPAALGLEASGEGGADVTAHNERIIVLSYPAVHDPDYLGTPHPSVEVLTRTFAFCAGYEAARFIADADSRFGTPDWAAPAAGYGELPTRVVRERASAVAAAASEFTMVADDEVDDPQSHAVQFFLQRLYALEQTEGAAALWRGAVGQATLGLMREVAFSEVPGRVDVFGARLRDAADLRRLVRYAGGEAPWPFLPRSIS